MLRFEKTLLFARFISPQGETVETPIEVRVNPITGRTCRITFSRTGERETTTDCLPAPPPFAGDTGACPFCRPQVHSRTPRILPAIVPAGRMAKDESILFPNLFPYGAYSAVSLIDDFEETGSYLFSDYLEHERADGSRFIGETGDWQWLAAFAPEGFFEIWAILPRITSLAQMTPRRWEELAAGILNVHHYYRSLNRNGCNLGLLIIESKTSRMELRAVLVARSHYAPWVRSDHTGFEVMLGEMATFVTPEQIAADARKFF